MLVYLLATKLESQKLACFGAKSTINEHTSGIVYCLVCLPKFWRLLVKLVHRLGNE